jgi:lambda family phage portal protein
LNALDKAIAFFSPQRALARARARAQLRIYDAAQPGRRATAWRARNTSANSEIGLAMQPLRNRARELGRNSPWAPRMLDVMVAHTVGTGLRPVPRTGSDRLDQKVLALWEEWNAEADVEGLLSFDAQQGLAMRSIIESGEIVLRFVDQQLENRRAKVPMNVQLLEGDFIDHQREGVYSNDQPAGTLRSRLGVGLGKDDFRTGLWLWPYHPGEMTSYNMKAFVSAFYPRDEILHVFRPERPGQVRGVSWFAPILLTARDLGDYMDSALVKARVEACFAGFIENSDELEPVMDANGAITEAGRMSDVTMLEPGIIKELKSGQKISFASPTSTSQIEPVMMTCLMAMAAGVGCTYDQATGDLRGANYSSLRAGKIDFRKLVSQTQELMIKPRFCAPTWNRFISRAILAGELAERPKGYPCDWVTPAWESINPKFDQDAEERSVRAGRMSPQDFIAEWGYDWRKVIKDSAEFYKLCDESGVVFDIDARKLSRAGQAQPDPAATAGAPGGGKVNGAGGNGASNGATTLDGFTDPDGNPIDPDELQDMLDQAAEEGSRVLPFGGSKSRRERLNRGSGARDFDENEHPRDDDGKWTDGGGSEEGSGGQGGGSKAASQGTAAAARPAGAGSSADGPAGGKSGAYAGGSPSDAKGSGALEGATLKQTFAPDAQLTATFEDAGATPLEFHELGEGGGDVFHRAIEAAKSASEYGSAVGLYGQSEYGAMRTFLTGDGKAGFALKGNDIVSVFRHPDSTAKNAVASLLQLAVDQGGRRLDCFDTVLPKLYGAAGFRATHRIHFSDEAAPEGWDKELFAKFNGGEPDVVFMVYDPAAGGYKAGDGELVDDYDKAVEGQIKAVRGLTRRRRRKTKREFNEEDHPRDEGGKWTDGGGSDDGGGSSGSTAASTASTAVAATAKPKASAASTTTTSTAAAKPKQKELWPGKFPPVVDPADKVKVDDFTKGKVDLASGITSDKAKLDKFTADWDDRVKVAPEEFKKDFLGGQDGTMTINSEDEGDDTKWTISGKVHDAAGNVIGNYTREIDWAENKAESAYFKLNSGTTNKGIGKTILAANVEQYQKLGLDGVKVHANIDVGGYAWAKYGYVPTEQSWDDLSREIIDRIDGSSSSPRADSWDELGSSQQDDVRDAWKEATADEFLDSEVESWRESGQALDDAKTQLAQGFEASDSWAADALTGWRDARPADAPAIALSNEEILAATSVEYSGDGEGERDPDVTIDLELTPEVADEIEAVLVGGFNKQAESDAEDADPPNYLKENISEHQNDVWDGMRDSDKYSWADNNGKIDEIAEQGGGDGDSTIPNDEADDLRSLAESGDPKAVWAIADSEHGKELLLGTDWFGELDFNDEETMGRFNAYVGKAANASA